MFSSWPNATSGARWRYSVYVMGRQGKRQKTLGQLKNKHINQREESEKRETNGSVRFFRIVAANVPCHHPIDQSLLLPNSGKNVGTEAQELPDGRPSCWIGLRLTTGMMTFEGSKLFFLQRSRCQSGPTCLSFAQSRRRIKALCPR
jgi:hypothetical protein